MVIQDLRRGEELTLEIMWGTSNYEMTTSVLAVKGDGIIVSAIEHKGITLDLGLGKFKDMSYNLYTIVNAQRIGWKNVQIELVTLTNQKKAYYVKTFNFAKMSSSGERREEERTVVDSKGFVWIDDKKIPVHIHDISSKGVSFYVHMGNYLYLDQPVSVQITDKVRGKDFDLTVNCKIARREDADMEDFVGCTIGRETKELLFYVYNKRLAMARI